MDRDKRKTVYEKWIAVIAGAAVFVAVILLASIKSSFASSTVSIERVQSQIEKAEAAAEAESAGQTAAGKQTQPKGELAEGLVKLDSLKKRDPEEVSREIQRAKKEQREKELLEVYQNQREKLANGEVDIWSLFKNSCILGDSRSEAFFYYKFLTEDEVFAVKGANLRVATEHLQDVKFKDPWNLYFNYGTNDADGNWGSAEQFIEEYEKVIEAYKAELPEADIYVCSIMPVTDEAIKVDEKLKNIPIYDAAVKEMCERKGYCYIDCNSLTTEYKQYYEPDGIHFQAAMCERWAALVLEATLQEKISRSEAALEEVAEERAENGEEKTAKQIAEEEAKAQAGRTDEAAEDVTEGGTTETETTETETTETEEGP